MNVCLPLRFTVLAAALTWVLASSAGAAGTGAATSPSRFAQLALDRGTEAQLPPHLAMTLSVGDGSQPVPARQIAVRVGTVVHTYNVVSRAGRQIVLIRTDEASQETSAYLLRADGSLRRAVRYQSGGVPEVLAVAAAGAGYRLELRFWNETLGAQPPPLAHGPGAAAPHP